MAHAIVPPMQAIGYVFGGRQQDSKDYWGNNRCELRLREDLFTDEVIVGLEEHSHLEVVFFFHHQVNEPVADRARHPRNNPEWPRVGIYAQRARMRTNRIGTTICRIEKISGLTISVSGLDAINGTPLLDIKPVWQENLPDQPVDQPQWSHELMLHYWKNR